MTLIQASLTLYSCKQIALPLRLQPYLDLGESRSQNDDPFLNLAERAMKHKSTLCTLKIALLLILSFVLASCSKVTKQNYDKVQTDMKLEEVEAVLGKQHQPMSAGAKVRLIGISGQTLTWKEDDRTITVMFVNERVILKSQVGL